MFLASSLDSHWPYCVTFYHSCIKIFSNEKVFFSFGSSKHYICHSILHITWPMDKELFFCFVTGVSSQNCRRAPHSKLCQSPSHFRHRLVLEPGYPMSGILQSLLWAYYPGISHRASRTDLQWIIDRPVMRLCYQEAVSYYCSVIVGKPYLTILRGSTGYRDSLALSAQALCRTRA